MIKIQRTWETVHFTASRKEVEIEIELTLNHKTKKIDIIQSGEEGVHFDEDSIEEAELRAKAILAAVKYAKKNL